MTSSSLFQWNRKYIVSTIKSGMVVIHQHRAHQRVLYEEVLKNITMDNAVSQQLLFPLQFEFTPYDIQLLNNVKEQLENTGFVFDTMEKEEVVVSGIPTLVTNSEVPVLFEQLLDDLRNDIPDQGFSLTDLLAKSIAKSVAVRTGVSLEPEQQQHLVHSLFACTEPSLDPNQLQTFITISLEDLDKKF